MVELLITRTGREVENRDSIEDLLIAYGVPADLRGEQIYRVARRLSDANRVQFPKFLYG